MMGDTENCQRIYGLRCMWESSLNGIVAVAARYIKDDLVAFWWSSVGRALCEPQIKKQNKFKSL